MAAVTLMSGCNTPPESRLTEWPDVTNETKPWTRWWWEGSAVRTVDLDSLMPLYSEVGLGGLEVTPIYGVHGYEDRFLDFLSEEWTDIFLYTLDKAKALGMGIDLANASGWPFGGPWVTQEDACKFFTYRTWHVKCGESLKEKVVCHQDGFVRLAGQTPVRLDQVKEPVSENKNLQEMALDQVRFTGDLPLIVLTATNPGGEAIDLTKYVDDEGRLNWTAPESDWTLIALFEGLHGKMVERAGPGGEGDVIDHFSDAAIDAYLKRFDEAFEGKDISYLRYYFNDSYEVDDARGESNWTPQLFEEFQRYRGYDLRQHLLALIGRDIPEKNARVLYDYRQTISDMLTDHYSTRWHEWALRQGKGIRNQAHGSPANILDLYAVSDVPEIEGRDLVSIKSAPSVAHTQGKRLVSSESATWLNEHFQSNLGDVKNALDLFFLGGVNHIFYHGTCFSPNDGGWPGWLFYAAVHFHPNNPFWGDFKYLNQYVTRAQSFLQDGKPDNDVLLLYNIADELSTRRGEQLLEHFAGLDRSMMHSPLRQCAVELTEKGFSWDMISDRQLLGTSVDNGEIVTPGARYKTVVVSGSEYIPAKSMLKLRELAEAGATVLFYRGVPRKLAGMHTRKLEAEFNETVMAFAGDSVFTPKGKVIVSDDMMKLMADAGVKPEPMYQLGLQCIRRISDEGKYYFIKNTGGEEVKGYIPLLVEAESAAVFNLMTGYAGLTPVRCGDGVTEVYVELSAGESLVISTSALAVEGDLYPYYERSGEAVEINAGWKLTFVEGGPELPAAATLDALGSWTELAGKEYKSFSGTAEYECTLPELEAADAYRLDLGDLAENASVYLNGEYVGTVISKPYTVVIPAYKLKGGDVLRVRVANSMANRIAYLDKTGVEWKKFYNINMSGRRRENVKRGIFDASAWDTKPSGLFGPVALTPLTMK